MNMKSQRDPVCGMNIQVADAPDLIEYNDKTYYFCSSECKSIFDDDPDQYATREVRTGQKSRAMSKS